MPCMTGRAPPQGFEFKNTTNWFFFLRDLSYCHICEQLSHLSHLSEKKKNLWMICSPPNNYRILSSPSLHDFSLLENSTFYSLLPRLKSPFFPVAPRFHRILQNSALLLWYPWPPPNTHTHPHSLLHSAMNSSWAGLDNWTAISTCAGTSIYRCLGTLVWDSENPVT